MTDARAPKDWVKYCYNSPSNAAQTIAELHKALQNLLADMANTGVIDAYNEVLGVGVSGAVADARAAITKAEGREPRHPSKP